MITCVLSCQVIVSTLEFIIMSSTVHITINACIIATRCCYCTDVCNYLLSCTRLECMVVRLVPPPLLVTIHQYMPKGITAIIDI